MVSMKIFFCIFLFFYYACVFAITDTSFSNEPFPLLPKQNTSATVPPPPPLEAKGAILIDAFSGKTLMATQANTRLEPASLTKMMTAYLASDALAQGRLHLDDKVYVSEKAWHAGGSKMFLKVGDSVSVRDLLQGIIVQSGNDASIAIAEHLTGSEEAFVQLMNHEAKQLGMTQTHFTNCTGMPNPDHYSSPRDLALLSRAIIFNYPYDYKLYSQKWFSFNSIKQPNRNRLLWHDEAVDGIKTGHTDTAGFCLAASAMRNNMRLIAVVMGEPSDKSRMQDTQKLLNYGFHFYETKPIFTAFTPLEQARIWLGKEKTLPVGVTQTVYVTVPAGQFKNIQTKLELADNLHAPINKNQVVGNIRITLNNETVLLQPAIALKDDPRANIFTRIHDHTHLALQKLFNKKAAT